MIDGEIAKPVTTHVMRGFWLCARCGGSPTTEVELGRPVRSGDVLCRIVDVFGEEVECVVAPADGLFVRATTLSTVTTGERVATLGIL